jgi:CheY-like chemotaxis protein
LGCSNVCIQVSNMPELGLAWPFASALWIYTADESGSNLFPDRGQPSDSPSLTEETRKAQRFVLVVEDNEADVLLIREAIEAANLPVTLHVVSDGEHAVAFLDRADSDSTLSCPDLVILDINLPKLNGWQVLNHMRQKRRCKDTVVLAVSTSDSPRDREQMIQLGANGYFRKPSDYGEFMKLGDIIRMLLDVT